MHRLFRSPSSSQRFELINLALFWFVVWPSKLTIDSMVETVLIKHYGLDSIDTKWSKSNYKPFELAGYQVEISGLNF